MGQYSKYRLYYKEEYDGEKWVTAIPLQYYGEMIEENSQDCGYIPLTPIYKWEDSDETMCDGTSLYYKSYEWVSYDNGVTWEKTGNTRAGTLIEKDASECGYTGFRWTFIEEVCEEALPSGSTSGDTDPTAIYKWETDGDTTCVGFDLHYVEYEWMSHDSGTTWYKTGKERIGRLIERNSEDCGYTPPVDYSNQYFTLVALSDGNIRYKSGYADRTASYSIDNGTTWSEQTSAVTISVNSGDTVLWKAERSSNVTFGGNFSGTTAQIEAQGNIMSLIYGDNFANQFVLTKLQVLSNVFRLTKTLTDAKNLVLPATTLSEDCYATMFAECTNLKTAPKLPATTLAVGCYRGMFDSCSSLTTAPSLPSTTLAQYCYSSMYKYCTSLTTAPILPATTLAQSCYSGMFSGCTALVQAPQLPSETLAVGCYYYMFDGCTSLTQAPSLLATTLSEACYRGMFNGCSSLTQAPELLAPTLVKECYRSMFNACSNLKWVKMMATDKGPSSALNGWIGNVAASGTFIKDANTSLTTCSSSGIPCNWTVINL